MNINFTITYIAHFDLDQAVEDFHEMHYWDPYGNVDKLLHKAIDQNITWSSNVDDLPDEVINTAMQAMRLRIGGIQMEMELDLYEN